ncbi:MAG: asparaginase [Desulfobacteraceae bacterium]|nr:asparaginase [Desulfobacteraceae bacterium]
MKKKIYIAYTGGTIGMGRTETGYQPVSGYLAKLFDRMPELQNPEMPEFDIHEYRPLIDSSNISPRHWWTIASDIHTHYRKYDGFVILHGTDTMAYTASALSYMLRGLEKPVILTGGQIPLCELRNDSRENLITSMMIAANYKIPEVCLFFGGRLMRGNRTVKVNANAFEAFDSPNFSLLGVAGISIDINWNLILPPVKADAGMKIQDLGESPVAALRLFPGISSAVVKNILNPPIKGIVLETYGVGNGPSNDKALLKVLKDATDREVVIVNCTQCLKGKVSMDAYATGTALGEAGVISGLDMTAEAALTKMFYLFSRDLSGNRIRTTMQLNLRGELSGELHTRSSK